MVDADNTESEEENQIAENGENILQEEQKIDFVQLARELAANTLKERELAFKKLNKQLFERYHFFWVKLSNKNRLKIK